MIWKHVIIHSHKVNEIVSLSESSALHSNWFRSSCSINIAGYILNKPWKSWETPNAVRPITSYTTKPGTIVPFPNHHLVDESSPIHRISIRTSDPLPTIIELLSCPPVEVWNVILDEAAPTCTCTCIKNGI